MGLVGIIIRTSEWPLRNSVRGVNYGEASKTPLSLMKETCCKTDNGYKDE